MLEAIGLNADRFPVDCPSRVGSRASGGQETEVMHGRADNILPNWTKDEDHGEH
jgi:hypothetical protein